MNKATDTLSNGFKMMNNFFKTIIIIAIVAGIYIMCSLLFGKGNVSVSEVSLSEIQNISQLKVITYNKEVAMELRKTINETFGPKTYKLAMEAPGKINIGFDLSSVGSSWLQKTSDSTVVITLPSIKILNKNNWYIKETSGRSIDNNPGVWSATERQKLASLLNAKVKHDCELEQCYQKGEEQAAKLLKTWLSAYGFKEQNISINFTPRVNYGAMSWKEEYARQLEQKSYVELSLDDRYYNQIHYVDAKRVVYFNNGCTDDDIINIIYAGPSLNNGVAFNRDGNIVYLRDYNNSNYNDGYRNYLRVVLNSNDSIRFLKQEGWY